MSECARSSPRATDPYKPTANKLRPSRRRSSAVSFFARSNRGEGVIGPNPFGRETMSFPPPASPRTLWGPTESGGP